MPIPVVALVLGLNATRNSQPVVVEEKGAVEPSAPPTVQNSRATSLEGTMVDDTASPPPEKADTPTVAKNPHIPTTGYGPTPLTRRELMENAAVIVAPAMLLTIEQAIRVAQIYYLPTPHESLPWVCSIPSTETGESNPLHQYMSKATFWTFIFGLESITISILGLAVLPQRFTHLSTL